METAPGERTPLGLLGERTVLGGWTCHMMPREGHPGNQPSSQTKNTPGRDFRVSIALYSFTKDLHIPYSDFSL